MPWAIPMSSSPMRTPTISMRWPWATHWPEAVRWCIPPEPIRCPFQRGLGRAPARSGNRSCWETSPPRRCLRRMARALRRCPGRCPPQAAASSVAATRCGTDIWWRIGRQFGPFDAAFLPVNGARFGWRKPVSGQPGVLTPEQAVAAATILGARTLVPIHYGVSGMAEYVEVDQPLDLLREAARGRALAVQVVAPGGWVDWEAPSPGR